MKRRALHLSLLVALVALGAAGCARRSPPQVSVVDADRANVALADLQQGRKLLLGKCAGCHKTPMPNDHTKAEWPRMIDEMADRAHLDTMQRTLIARYLVAMSERD